MEYLTPGQYIKELESSEKTYVGVGTSLACFVGRFMKGTLNKAVLITSWKQFVNEFGGLYKNTLDFITPYVVKSFFDNGGTRCYVVRVAHSDVEKASAVIKDSSETLDTLKINAINEGAWGNNISVVISIGTSQGYKFIIKYNSEIVEIFDNVIFNKITTNINNVSKYITTEILSGGGEDLKTGTYNLEDGSDGSTLIDNDYIGSQTNKTGLYACDEIDEMCNLAVPGVTSNTIISTFTNYCYNRGFFVFLTTVPLTEGVNKTPNEAKTWKQNLIGITDLSYLVIDYPYVVYPDPLNLETGKILIPQEGITAGLCARADNTRGVGKAPAGIDFTLSNVLDLAYNVTDEEQGVLNPIGINCARKFSGIGIVKWGARTSETINVKKIYFNVRRVLNYLKTFILYNTKWMVFEPNDSILRSTNVSALKNALYGLYKNRILVGDSPETAYYVICDSSNNTPETIAQGLVITEIGVSITKPAEFVVFNLIQWNGGTSIKES